MQTGSDKANIIPLYTQKASQQRVRGPSMKEKLAHLPTPVLRLREVSLKQLKALAQNLFDHVDDALFELADRATSNLEQNVFFESMRDIRIQRRNMEQVFLDHLDKQFVELLDSSNANNSAGDNSDDQAERDDLSLVGKDELEELVAIDSLVSKSWSHNKGALHNFAVRLNTLVPAAVSEKHNPVSPRVLADGFHEAVQLVSIDIKAKLVLFKLFERYVMNQVGSVLAEMNQALSDLGIVVPQQRADASSVSSRATRSAPVAAPAEHIDETGLYATLRSLIETRTRHAARASYTDTSYVAPGDYGVAEVSQQLLQALSDLQHQQVQQNPVVGAVQHARPQLLPAQYIATAIANTAGEDLIDDRSGDVMRLVDMLFSFILEDRSLPDPVKLLLSRLQIPFIKVALADEEFFKKDGHPARRLLNEMATASIGWTGDLYKGKKDPLIGKIESLVEKILNEFDDNFDIFTVLLTDFVAFLEKERRRIMLFEKRAIDAEGGKAKAELGRQQVDAKVAEIIAGQQLPDAFSQFISGPWSNILFLIFMRQGEQSAQWREAVLVAERLVWSAQLIESDKHKAQLRALLPNLLSSLKKGLEDVSFNPVKQVKIFDKLKAHYLNLFERYRTEGFTQVTPASEDSVVEGDINDVSPEYTPSAESDTVPPVLDEPESVEPVAQAQAADTEVVVETQSADQQYSNLVDNFVVGVWFEKSDGGSSSFRCRLAAIIRATGKYIFVNRAGVKVAEETRETLAVLLERGQLRTLDDSMLFDRALESVISSLRS
ncbi:MAG: DUF1631 domain-containing protein [Cellvibrionaceae bacterium]|nr:DUF1631 domain-containing protein [Cellvibrionaceae bacterium]